MFAVPLATFFNTKTLVAASTGSLAVATISLRKLVASTVGAFEI